ncbi:hypothetical protein [Nocardia nova]|nr:hypothetical protein [Nocardia nova]
MGELCGAGSSPLRCLSLGPLTDIARLLIADTRQGTSLGLKRWMHITAMGGALDYRRPGTAGHSWRMNPVAVQTVLAEAEPVTLVLSEHTFIEEIAVSACSPIYRLLASRPDEWARLLREHYDQFFACFYDSSKLHDAVGASPMLGRGFVRGSVREFELRRDARMCEGTGTRAWLSEEVDTPPIMAWVEHVFRDVQTTGAAQVMGRLSPEHVGSL